MEKRLALIAIAECVALFVVGCASSTVLVGKARPAISPDQVKLYLRPPAKYEEIAIVEASSRNSFSFSDQGRTDKVIQRMKAEAAGVGANGVLLQGVGREPGGAVAVGSSTATVSGNTAYGVGTGVAVPINRKAGSGVAIYVIEE